MESILERFSDNLLQSLETFMTLKTKEPEEPTAETTQKVEPLITNIYQLYI